VHVFSIFKQQSILQFTQHNLLWKFSTSIKIRMKFKRFAEGLNPFKIGKTIEMALGRFCSWAGPVMGCAAHCHTGLNALAGRDTSRALAGDGAEWRGSAGCSGIGWQGRRCSGGGSSGVGDKRTRHHRWKGRGGTVATAWTGTDGYR
jgi:hypothetical protein